MHALHKENVWAHDACSMPGVTALDVNYLSRRFMLELLSDVNTSSTARPVASLHRWLIDGHRWRVIMEIGAGEGGTTCGLFQQKAFRIDAQPTFGVDRTWEHIVIAVDDWHTPDDEARSLHLGKPLAYWRFLCNLQNRSRDPNPDRVGDCPRQPDQRVVPLPLRAKEAFLAQRGHLLSVVSKGGVFPELIYLDPPRRNDSLHAFENASLGFLWDDVLECNGSLAGHGFEREDVQRAVTAFAESRGLVLERWWIHAPHTRWERVFEWSAAPPRQPLAVWGIRQKQTCITPHRTTGGMLGVGAR
jgi:hypothetical protein